MTRWIGHDEAEATLRRAALAGKLHHAWILGGPRGLGKASFALAAAHWLLDHGDPAKTAAMIAAGSHPDLKILRRLPKDSVEPGAEVTDADLRRNIAVDQIRELGPALATRPSIAKRRVILIDSIDDLERAAANALLKNLEEPPEGTLFLSISHAPGRLLPTIRSRCQILRFDPLDDAAMADAIRQAIADITPDELQTLVRAGDGSPGKALSFAGLQLAALEQTIGKIAAEGDRDNRLRTELASKLSLKASHARYEAFLRRVPGFIAETARDAPLAAAPAYLAAWEEASALSQKAMPLNIDKQAAVLEMCRILAQLSGMTSAVRA